MLLLVVALPALTLGWYIDARTRADYRLALRRAGLIGSRQDFLSAEGFRNYPEKCRRAEVYLGVTPRQFEKGAGLWTDEDERLYDKSKQQFIETELDRRRRGAAGSAIGTRER